MLTVHWRCYLQNSQNCSQSSNGDRGIYLEIYKLQIDTITKISDRRVNVSRYYIFAISALILALSVVSSSEFLEIIKTTSPKSFESSEKSEDSKNESEDSKNESEDSKSITFAMGVMGGLGSILTFSWILNMLGYLISNTKRYERIKNLETLLPYQFTKSIWKSTPKRNASKGNTKKYFDFAAHELLTPFVFCLGFTMLSLYGFCEFFFTGSEKLPYILFAGFVGLLVLFCIIFSKERKNVQG